MIERNPDLNSKSFIPQTSPDAGPHPVYEALVWVDTHPNAINLLTLLFISSVAVAVSGCAGDAWTSANDAKEAYPNADVVTASPDIRSLGDVFRAMGGGLISTLKEFGHLIATMDDGA